MDQDSRHSGVFVPEDVARFKVETDLDLAQDGTLVVYSLEEVDSENDRYISNLWLVPSSGGEPEQLTFGKDRNRYPRFSPDGTELAFLSDRRAGPPQLYCLRLSRGEARQLTRLEGGAGEPVWSPDGRCIAFSAPVQTDGPANAPRVVNRTSYKLDGPGYILNRPTQIFIVPSSGGDARQVTRGEASATEPCWSPDSRRLAFSRLREARRESHLSDIWIAALDEENPRQLTTRCAHCMAPSWSPDGRGLAFYATREAGAARRRVWVTDVDEPDERPLTSEDEEVADFPLGRTAPPVWSEDGAELATISVTATRSRIDRMNARTGERREIVAGDRQITMMSGAPRGRRVAYLWSDPRLCGNIATAAWDGTDERELLNVNEAWARERRWPRASLRDFAGSGGRGNHGLLFLPSGTGPWPLFVDVHGGPQAYVELGFPYHPYWYILASRGWAILSLNPVGSASYGKEFADRLRGRWGEADLPEHLAAVDGLVSEGIADGNRVAIGGKSYGGYMAAWAIGKTHRFRAAVCSAPVTNLESHFGTSDSGCYVDPYDLRAEPFEERARYHRLSPIHGAAGARTPTLILHGEDDQRCPIGQGEELFATLIRAGKTEVEFVRYPGGTHRLAETGRPSHRVDYNRRIADWIERHCS